MLKTKITLQVASPGALPDDAILLGEPYLKQWKIPQGQSIILQFGSFRQHAKAIPSPALGGLKVSHSLARRMGILGTASLRFQYKPSSQTLALGPLIGVLISRDYQQASDKPFGSITMFCRELVDACKQQGAYVYFFTPNQIGPSSLEGWVYAGGWHRIKVPAPNIVNNRLTSRKLENRPNVQQFIAEVKSRYNTQVFNEKFLDKSEVFEALRGNPSLHRYLPESHSLRSVATLRAMCSRYHTVFLKPVRGSLGKGIIRITRTDSGTYYATYTTSTGSTRQHFPSLIKLFASISGKMKTVRYQIQQGLQLIEASKRPIDFRALVQKNASGSWTVTSIVARTAGAQHFVSNLARGGTLSTVKEAVAKSNMAAASKEGASTRLQKASIEIAKGIEASIPAHFGELGIDLALDVNGRVWLLEVNSKPSKNDNTPLKETKIRPSVRLMVQYARYLSGF